MVSRLRRSRGASAQCRAREILTPEKKRPLAEMEKEALASEGAADIQRSARPAVPPEPERKAGFGRPVSARSPVPEVSSPSSTWRSAAQGIATSSEESDSGGDDETIGALQSAPATDTLARGVSSQPAGSVQRTR